MYDAFSLLVRTSTCGYLVAYNSKYKLEFQLAGTNQAL